MLKISNNSGFNNKKASGAFRSSAGNTAATIALPSDIKAGDLIVIFDSAENASGIPAQVVPVGFSIAVNITGVANRRAMINYKIATSQDAGASYVGLNGTNNNAKMVAVFAGPYSYAQSFSPTGEITANNPAPQTILSAQGKTDLFAVAAYREPNPGATFTPTQDGKIVAGLHEFWYKSFRNNPQDVVIDTPDNGSSNILAGCYISTI